MRSVWGNTCIAAAMSLRGATIAITIKQGNAAPAHLSAYRYANATSGDVGGDLPGFISAIGIAPFS